MATRSTEDEKDRLTTILIAPLMTCSARLPVYTLIIGTFIPNTPVIGFVRMQGLVMFSLYMKGIVGAFFAALVLRRTVTKGASSGFMMEMPKYQWPRARDVLIGLYQRAWIFLRRAGTIILFSTIILWALLSFPKPPAGSDISEVNYSVAGRIANTITPAFEPIGFNRDITLALIPAMAARDEGVVMCLGRAAPIIWLRTFSLWHRRVFPKPPAGSDISEVNYSVAGRIANTITPAFEPIGFNRDITLALIPAMAAREVAVAAIGTVYAIDDPDAPSGQSSMIENLRKRWTLPTALAFLMWFVFAPQCISTIAITRRETNGWKWPAFMVGYLFVLAYIASGATYWIASAIGL